MGFIGLIFRLSPVTGEGSGVTTPVASVAPTVIPLVTVPHPPPRPTTLLPFATPVEGEGESSVAVEAWVAGDVAPDHDPSRLLVLGGGRW